MYISSTSPCSLQEKKVTSHKKDAFDIFLISSILTVLGLLLVCTLGAGTSLWAIGVAKDYASMIIAGKVLSGIGINLMVVFMACLLSSSGVHKDIPLPLFLP